MHFTDQAEDQYLAHPVLKCL